MKNIMVIDGAENCVYDVFAAEDEEFTLLFPSGTDVAFIEDIVCRSDADDVLRALSALSARRVPKAQAMGIHGVLFYELHQKRKYYPTLRDEEAVNPDG